MFRRRLRPSVSPSSNVSSQNILNVLTDPHGANIDIVAIHGLNPFNKQTHAEDTWTAGDKLWLRDFLPKQVPQARVFLYGYNANVVFKTATAGVREQATILLDQVANKRTECPSRPIIFIAHSLGGLIVKRALVHARKSEKYEDIWRWTYGLVFFGTPHEGGSYANLGGAMAGGFRWLAGNPENTFMKALQHHSTFSNVSTDDFRQLLEDFQVKSFYETLPLGRFGLVVEQESATLGLPDTREQQIPMSANHRDICKFSSADDPRYKQVADVLVPFIHDAISWSINPTRGRRAYESGNISTTSGEYNDTIQAGREHRSNTSGNGNRTNQAGIGNRNETKGNNNTTTQIEVDPKEAWRFVEKHFMGSKSSRQFWWDLKFFSCLSVFTFMMIILIGFGAL